MTFIDYANLWEIDFGKIGFVTGIVSLIISIFNYKRDKSKIVVSLQWDANPREKYGLIFVTNVGRRSTYITSVGIQYPNENHVVNLLTDGLNATGRKLTEGDAPIEIRVYQTGELLLYSHEWNNIRAIAIDSLGKWHKSTKIDSKPSWVK